ncbi:MAG: DUF3467 domain-containing protein [Planctomycetes bacterium]|nr:DUF3467 domain-containing protein [Planctomycetota bacterium]
MSTTPKPGDAAAANQVQVRFDESKLVAMYANFVRVTPTPEELVLDFCLNAHPLGATEDPIPVGQRIVMNYYCAKRMMMVLHQQLSRHEAAFGVLETDVQRRLIPSARQGQQRGE